MSAASRPAMLLLLVLSFSTTLSAQDETSPVLQRSSPVITAAIADGKFRFSAPAGVAHIRLQIVSPGGETLFDSAWRDGNVLDWPIESSGQPLADGSYRCVVMASDLDGQVTRKESTIAAKGGQVSMVPRGGTEGLTIVEAGENGPKITMLAHDGESAAIVSTSGDLRFRFGNFLAGQDSERMRLTAEGNLGVGTDKPQARLDVNGLIRTSEGIKFADGTILTTAAGVVSARENDSIIRQRATAPDTSNQGQARPPILPLSPRALARPIPRTNFAPAYQFVVNDTGVTIGTTNPAYRLDVAGPINTASQYNIGGVPVLSVVFPNNLFAGVSGSLMTGGNNSFFGMPETGGSNTSGGSNSFFGANAGRYNDAGNRNSYFGHNAGHWFAGSGSDNSFLGEGAGFGNFGVSTGNFNSLFGSQSAASLTSGSQNTVVGGISGVSLTTQSNITLLGYSTEVSPGITNATAVGAFAKATQSNTLILGGVIGVNGATAVTSVGIGTTAPNQFLSVGGGITVDALNGNDGTLFSNGVLSFGGSGSDVSGEAIGSQRTAGAGQYGLDFYTQYAKRMSIANNGNVTIVGTLSKGAGSFKIDHPLDPENKYLYHSFVESPDMMNIYNGNVILDERGEAVVLLPEWFEALNQEFRYQLTCLHGFAPVYIDEEISGNRFKIAGGKPGIKVSWQVTGIRHDAYASAHRIPVEEAKPAEERGTLLYSARQR